MSKNIELSKNNVNGEEQIMAVVAHLAPLIGYSFLVGQILIPLGLLLYYRGKSDFVVSHAKDTLNFHISLTIYWAITIVTAFMLVGLIFVIPLLLLQLITMFIAAYRAGHGQAYRYPLTIKFID